MDQYKRILKEIFYKGVPYSYKYEGADTPMKILTDWVNKTDMKSVTIGLLKDWFEELEELENEMIIFYKNNNGTL